ncbi:Nucleoside diphosphate-linked moiety X motif 19 [Holothuria leucospilota]|uniref:Nucleoside diphosphate-linked moiety X motif 19 n=1 Tax=Holothuria leucospilota TaxID=206669 RepID=A0A9Q1BDB7_HOLLE|nr:Nucleoside diphosphate-linked moiety X motif 19 [Holothuria leucospilota]
MLSTRLRALTFTCRTSRYLVKPRAVKVCMDQFSESVIGLPCTRMQSTAATDAEHQKHWRDAASLMVCAKDYNQPQNSVFDYRMLFLKRQGGSNVFGGTSVFPGGVIDDADFSPEWMQLYRALGIETVDSFGWEHLKNKPRAGPIASPRAKDLLPNDVAFRLCAIRETFEESGILIASSHDYVKQSMKRVSAKSFAPSSCYTELDENKFLEWRQRIYNDANQFLVMCKELDIFPNLWSLFELSNTLTPRAGPRRYDTIFYLNTLDSVPEVIIDEREMANDQWLNPAEGLQLHFKGDINLYPPQLLECARFLDFPGLTDVQNYGAKIMDEGMDISLPVGYRLKDCLIHAYPGDDCYPKNVSLASISKVPKLEETEEDNLRRCKNLHRITFYGTGRSLKFDCNIKLPHNEHPPQNFSSQDWVDQSTA